MLQLGKLHAPKKFTPWVHPHHPALSILIASSDNGTVLKNRDSIEPIYAFMTRSSLPEDVSFWGEREEPSPESIHRDLLLPSNDEPSSLKGGDGTAENPRPKRSFSSIGSLPPGRRSSTKLKYPGMMDSWLPGMGVADRGETTLRCDNVFRRFVARAVVTFGVSRPLHVTAP
ncbi:hypothetical protein STIAU_1531 [Stigmatella aurantiaca DW4/3-1]|uniref:Uncharacterized protein n=1 Tax=Stigmatella aurantiaca (strain DW4/3-1) TaxID=378806 RepID=Q09DF2_STIAD|nr:hypothetical protein STIAU_1531 [Stigmatella aurantiaca DW4/3-1]